MLVRFYKTPFLGHCLLLACLSSLPSLGWAQDSLKLVAPKKKYTLQEYVDIYKEIAIREMERSGIPASITLAQGIHESGCGNSRLATEANNHFGIKCHKGWTGQTFYQWDDDPSESCFRVYTSGDSSYIDHTDFLTGRKHYSFLFEFDRTDYEKWAKGLKKAGYATDPTYPDKLIGTIQKHKLFQYDLAMGPIAISTVDSSKMVMTDPKTVYVIPSEVTRPLRKKRRSVLFPEYKKGLFRQNGTTYVPARENETALEVATRFDIPYRKFLKFNDLVDGDRLIDFQYCYIYPKKTKYKGDQTFHRVTDDVTMYEISQYYGIKLADLCERNMLKEGQEPRNGELIMLNDKVSVPPALRVTDLPIEQDSVKTAPINNPPIPLFPDDKGNTVVEQPLLINTPTYPDSIYHPDKPINTTVDPDLRYLNIQPINEDPSWLDKIYADSSSRTDWAPDSNRVLTPPIPDKKEDKPIEFPNNNTEPPLIELNPNTNSDSLDVVEEFTTHTVQPKETLFSLSRKYGLPVGRIKEYNNLSSDLLKEKQVLRIPKK